MSQLQKDFEEWIIDAHGHSSVFFKHAIKGGYQAATDRAIRILEAEKQQLIEVGQVDDILIFDRMIAAIKGD